MVQYHAHTFDPDILDREAAEEEISEPMIAYAVRSCDLMEWLAARPPRDISEAQRRGNIAANLAAQRKLYAAAIQDFVASQDGG